MKIDTGEGTSVQHGVSVKLDISAAQQDQLQQKQILEQEQQTLQCLTVLIKRISQQLTTLNAPFSASSREEDPGIPVTGDFTDIDN